MFRDRFKWLKNDLNKIILTFLKKNKVMMEILKRDEIILMYIL